VIGPKQGEEWAAEDFADIRRSLTNTQDKAALAELLDAHVVLPPAHTALQLCRDKSYDSAHVVVAARDRRFARHIRRRGEARRRCWAR
jgi:hypothetical protein